MAPTLEVSDAVAVSVDISNSTLVMDRGLTAWLQVLGSWILFMNTCWVLPLHKPEKFQPADALTRGLTNSFGVFETYYNETLLTDSTSSAIAWIGSIQLFLTMIIGVFAGVLLDAGHLRLLIVVGTFFEVFGMMMTSLCTEYWQILLAQAICTGIGSGLLGLTSVAVMPLYFSSRRMIATGIAATGSSLAGMIYPIMLQHLFRSLGFPWAVWVLAFLILGLQFICCAVMRFRPRQATKKKPFSLNIFKDRPYTTFVAGFALVIMSVYIPFFYIQSYALNLGLSTSMAFYLLSIINTSSLLGRLYGGVNVMIPACFLSAVMAFVLRAVSNEAGLIAVSSLYGFISGKMVSLPPAMIANLTIEKEEYGTRIGVGYTIAAVGALIGNPIAGALQFGSKSSKQSVREYYQGTWYFAGSTMMLYTVLLVIVRLLTSGKAGTR